MVIYRKHFSTRQTSQAEEIPGETQVKNLAGGYVYPVDKWTMLHRFLVLGSEAGTYYASEQKLTKENALNVLACIKEDGLQVVQTVTDISMGGRAPKNDPALFVLAMCAGLGDKETRKFALQNLPRVARIGTHLFHFAEYVEGFRGWGRSLREGVANWYNSKSTADLAYQVVKYQQRDGWSHRDLLRLSHPNPNHSEDFEGHASLYRWITKGDEIAKVYKNLEMINAFEEAKAADSVHTIVRLIREVNLPREAIPTRWLKEKVVWEALLEDMPMTALIRNLGNLGKNGVLVPGRFETVEKVINQITDSEKLKRARIHPLSILLALTTYQEGHGFRGSNQWPVVGGIVDALDEAFYLAFDNVPATG